MRCGCEQVHPGPCRPAREAVECQWQVCHASGGVLWVVYPRRPVSVLGCLDAHSTPSVMHASAHLHSRPGMLGQTVVRGVFPSPDAVGLLGSFFSFFLLSLTRWFAESMRMHRPACPPVPPTVVCVAHPLNTPPLQHEHAGRRRTRSSAPLLDCTETGITAFLAAVQAGPPGVDSAHAAILALAEAVRPPLGAGASDGAETTRRRQAVAAVAIPWIVSTLDVHGSSNPGLARDALALLPLASRYRHSDCEDGDQDEGFLTHLANPVARMLDVHSSDAAVVEAGLSVLFDLAEDMHDAAGTDSQVRGCWFPSCACTAGARRTPVCSCDLMQVVGGGDLGD